MELGFSRSVTSARQKFPLGRLVITAGASAALPAHDVGNAVRKHASGDWGELDEEDQAANERALVSGLRLLSAYRTECGIRFWIVTEWDRSVSTVLLPEEY